MSQKLPDINNTQDREMVITRLINAPRELVFKAWTDPDHIAEWWGPKGFSNTIHSMEVRKDGLWDFIMHGPDGTDYINKIIYLEIDEPARLVYSHSDDGAMHFLDIVTFEQVGDKTRVTLKIIFHTTEIRDQIMREVGAIEGGNQTLDRLERYLADSAATDDGLYISRVFDAPRELVFKAWSDPELAKKWWGPRAYSAPVAKMDFRVGGKYLLCMRGPHPSGGEGDLYSCGVYKEIIPGERIVCTDSFADEHGNIVDSSHYGMPGFPEAVTVIVTFEDYRGKTRMTLRQGMPAFMKEGANQGWNESFDKLVEALAAA